jgi:hypothetical protein
MMKPLLTIVLAGLVLPFSSFSHSNDPERSIPSEIVLKSDVPGELVVAFEGFSVKRIDELNSLFTDLPGIKNLGSCERLNVLYFTYDTAIYHSADEAYETLMLKTREFRPLLKTGSSISDVKFNCER